jgi:hypothetical protein
MMISAMRPNRTNITPMVMKRKEIKIMGLIHTPPQMTLRKRTKRPVKTPKTKRIIPAPPNKRMGLVE